MPSNRRIAAIALAVGIACAVAPRAARAEATVGELEDDPDLEGPRRSLAPDELRGRAIFDAGIGVVAPSGSLGVGRAFRRFATEGVSFVGSAEYGLSRSFTAALFGSIDDYGAPAGCPSCTAGAWSAGAGLVYHLTQGLAVDPWIRYGVAYRKITVEVPENQADRLLSGPTVGAFRSIDFVNLAIGADYFPVPSLGAGVFTSLDVGRSISRPLPDDGPANQTLFTLGFRVSWVPGRAALASPPRSARR